MQRMRYGCGILHFPIKPMQRLRCGYVVFMFANVIAKIPYQNMAIISFSMTVYSALMTFRSGSPCSPAAFRARPTAKLIVTRPEKSNTNYQEISHAEHLFIFNECDESYINKTARSY